ncbi:hypothetical protein OLZ33_01565 [Pantoea ananatis]|jgi:hypothetical protein|uniref:hypothetical protein n=1 Tax=Enterobacterales TaxID=91347 RepID=UPI00090719D1|nr:MULTISPECIES: hypothetical protein [Enterobacterales]MBA4820358.1 hypothetical protein [Pantoea ananatis]MCS4493668.1 hypothetical protein [Pantoea sp. B623]MCW1830688.1 hypothetical protein [Pantoea ananatis]QKV89910.1 hypothetical protein FOB88_23650 [Pantoea ananatis]REF11550.1 hypothetical protein C7428_0757 [Pantoea ananatis]
MSQLLDLTFEVIKKNVIAQNSAGCKTNGTSTCCSTYCTAKNCRGIENGSETESGMDAWDQYLQMNAGVLQY